MNIFQRLFFYSLILFCWIFSSQIYARLPQTRHTEVTLTPYPEKELSIQLSNNQQVIDYTLSPYDPTAAILLAKHHPGGYQIILWDLRANTLTERLNFPSGYKPLEIRWHPVDSVLFVLAQVNQQYVILKMSVIKNDPFKVIYTSSEPLNRLVTSPRPFGVSASTLKYRLFFGVLENGHHVIRSITEDGDILYQMMGNGTFVFNKHLFPDDFPPSNLTTSTDVSPAAFFPAGHLFAVENEQGYFDLARYGYDSNWSKEIKPLYGHTLHKGSISFLPNGLGVLHWDSKQKGVNIYLDNGKTRSAYLQDTVFHLMPSLSPDAKGIMGSTIQNNTETLIYKPVSIPLGNVENAWMFVESPSDRELLVNYAGLFRPLKENSDQLYHLYDSELYYCGDIDKQTPTRPYIITTDIFWEVLAAAYEGTFILIERENAIPHFWKFISATKKYYATHDPQNPWFHIFSVIEAINTKNPSNEIKKEFDLITQTSGKQASSLLPNEQLNYAELKPRGHYQASTDLESYFKAFKYLTLVSEAKSIDVSSLASLPQPITQEAILWIKSYLPFISAHSRAPLVFGNDLTQKPPYAYELKDKPELFPLSWGFDNEVLLRGVFHTKWPQDKQILGKNGPRLTPSSLDVAAALDNSLAFSILENQGEFKKYPPLKNTLIELNQLYKKQNNSSEHKTIYDQWINALAIQWADDINNSLSPQGEMIWKIKRLQTGLASWATLRHASVLVNERSAAECGEGGFEPLFTEFPRGFVEADPATFEAIAKLFDAIAHNISTIDIEALNSTYTENLEENLRKSKIDKTVKAGILRRLKTMQTVCLQFADMARRELKGEMLKESEYDNIVYIGRTIEHNFLVFKSLAKNDFALSTPDPITKIIDVAGGGPYGVSYLLAAVGTPLEWDFVYPLFGKKMIGKGAVYSFYEFSSDHLMDDRDWRTALNKQNPPAWIRPYMSQDTLSCPAKDSL